MIIVILGWAALLLGVWSTVYIGRRSRAGWVIGGTACVAWIIVNIASGILSGAISSSIGLALAFWNWRKWREEPKAAVLGDPEGL